MLTIAPSYSALMPERPDANRWNYIQALLRAAADPALVTWYRAIAPTGGVILGIKVPTLRTMVKSFAAANKQLQVSDAITIADEAFASNCREEMLFATFLLGRFKTRFAAADWQRLNVWINGIDNWETCDQLAVGVAGEIIARAEPSQRAKFVRDLEKWTKAKNPWRRRFALATTTALNQKGRLDATVALRISELLITDTDKNVQKALGWALREACKSDAAAVFALLKKHKSKISRNVLREAAEKLSTSRQVALRLAK